MVSASYATLPVAKTAASCNAAVMARMTNDHLIAQMPRSVVVIEGSIVPCVWPCPPGCEFPCAPAGSEEGWTNPSQVRMDLSMGTPQRYFVISLNS